MAQEQEYRHIKCANQECGVKIKFPVSEKNYGRTGTVTCKKCKTVMSVTIPVPAQTGGKQSDNPTGKSGQSDFLESLKISEIRI